jgi:hypothetical protein
MAGTAKPVLSLRAQTHPVAGFRFPVSSGLAWKQEVEDSQLLTSPQPLAIGSRRRVPCESAK